MTALDKELEQLQKSIESDTKNLIEKYISITSLDIPENDETEAEKRIIEIIKKTIKTFEEKN